MRLRISSLDSPANTMGRRTCSSKVSSGRKPPPFGTAPILSRRNAARSVSDISYTFFPRTVTLPSSGFLSPVKISNSALQLLLLPCTWQRSPAWMVRENGPASGKKLRMFSAISKFSIYRTTVKTPASISHTVSHSSSMSIWLWLARITVFP